MVGQGHGDTGPWARWRVGWAELLWDMEVAPGGVGAEVPKSGTWDWRGTGKVTGGDRAWGKGDRRTDRDAGGAKAAWLCWKKSTTEQRERCKSGEGRSPRVWQGQGTD